MDGFAREQLGRHKFRRMRAQKVRRSLRLRHSITPSHDYLRHSLLGNPPRFGVERGDYKLHRFGGHLIVKLGAVATLSLIHI